MRILVVEDELDLLETMTTFLHRKGFNVDGVSSIAELDEYMQVNQPDLIFLDVYLTGVSSLEWLANARMTWGSSYQPIVIILSGHSQLPDRILGLESGADQYLVKPVMLPELLAIVQRCQQRINQVPQWRLDVHRWLIIAPNNRFFRLTPSEYYIIDKLMTNLNQTVTRDALVDALSQDIDSYDFRRLETLISRLRNKSIELLEMELPIVTIRRMGYSFLQNS